MYTVDFFAHKVTKLIVGDNPMNGYSYITYQTPGDEMKRYYTAKNIKPAFGLEKEQIREKIKAVYEEVFSVLKPDDMAVIGVFQRDKDQLLENPELFDKWAAARG